MVATPLNPQLSVRDGNSEGSSVGWGPIQIATPLIVGGVLILAILAYVIWHRNPLHKRSYDYHPVRSEWATKIRRVFVPRRTRTRVLRSSAPITLDDSLRTASLGFDFSRTRQVRSGSSDSQAPLTSTTYQFDLHPSKRLTDSPPPIPNRRSVRWWWLFGSRPKEVKSQQPGLRWRVDGPDTSSTVHGYSNHEDEEYQGRYAGALEAVREDREEAQDDVIPIGENFASVASTPMTQHLPEQARAVRGMPTVSEHSSSDSARIPVPLASARPSNPGTPLSSANRGLPPSYDVSENQSRYAPAGDTARVPRSESRHIDTPPPMRTAVYSPLHAPLARELSTDSFLAAQTPMVTASIY